MKKEFDFSSLEYKIKALLTEAYDQGYKDAKEEMVRKVCIDGLVYYDLGLPSGTLWSKPVTRKNRGYDIEMFTYENAMKLNIPSIEQFEELLKHCNVYDLSIVGPNGTMAGYDKAGSARYWIYKKGEKVEEGRNMFWLRSEPNTNHKAKTMVFDNNILEIGEHFIGYRLPVMLVKE